MIAFQLGAFLGRIGDRVGAQKRSWLMAGTFVQALFSMAAAIAFWKSDQPSVAGERDLPSWTNALTFVGLAFMSASLGLQGIQGKRLNTQFGTTSAFIFVSAIIHYVLIIVKFFYSRVDHRLGGAFHRSWSFQN